MSDTYFPKGFQLKADVGPALARDYDSDVVGRLKSFGYSARAGDLVLRLAREFGFCYGVDRAVQYAYETRRRFPDRRIFVSGEIIHNPAVNRRLEGMGFRILDPGEPAARYAEVLAQDVVVLPAFGVTAPEMEHLKAKGCILVDTTCGSVMTVWKNVRNYAREGFTVIIHGKYQHEETKATASQAMMHESGQYLCVRDREEASVVGAFIRGELSAALLRDRFAHAAGPGFDPERHLGRIGLANQTTMLMSDSLQIQQMLRQAVVDRHGECALATRFRAFDTICSATQDRQDAILQMLEGGELNVMVVIGGFNSSNTQALALICAERLPTYHIDGPDRLEDRGIWHQPLGTRRQVRSEPWLAEGPVAVGLTAGASTPNSVVALVIERILRQRGMGPEQLGPEVEVPRGCLGHGAQ